MRRALFVCTGNLCRSPMAEYAFQQAIMERGLDNVLSESAGTMALEGNPAASRAVKEMSSRGVDMRGHRARMLTRQMIETADVVVVMEVAHVYTTLMLDPSAREKTILMGDLLDDYRGREIPDPYGGDDAFFSDTYGLIKRATDVLADKFKNNHL